MLPSYAQWLSRLHRLSGQVGALLAATCGHDPRAAEVAEAEILLLTRADAPGRGVLLSQFRQGVETMFSQWWHWFIDRVFSRLWEGPWNTLKQKVLHYNLVHASALIPTHDSGWLYRAWPLHALLLPLHKGASRSHGHLRTVRT